MAAGGAYAAYNPTPTPDTPTQERGPALPFTESTEYVGVTGHLIWDTRDSRYARDFGERYTPNTSWRVVSGKSEGKAVGLTIVDGTGDRYLLKFDSPGHIELSTGAEAIATRIFYALGYHVPQNYLVTFSRDQLEPAPDATYETKTGAEKPITDAAIDELLRNAAQYSDGTYRALASRFLSGTPLGPFKYHGTRPDDPNDIFPHETRRELRGLQVAAAWLNHDDSRSINSLDVYVEEDGRQFVRHYLIDFGTTLGGGPLGPKAPWAGREHIVDTETILSSAVTFGFVGRPWTRAEMLDIPAIGHFRKAYFDPEAWRPQYYNPAFANMDADDAFWMAKQIAHFTDREIRALVETGQYSDPRTTEYLAEVLIVRRNKIADAYLGHGGGLGRFAVEENRLVFQDLLARHAARTDRSVPRRYSVRWFGFDNETGRRTDSLGTATLRDTSTALPSAQARYVVVALSRPSHPGTTEVYLRRTGATRRACPTLFPSGRCSPRAGPRAPRSARPSALRRGPCNVPSRLRTERQSAARSAEAVFRTFSHIGWYARRDDRPRSVRLLCHPPRHVCGGATRRD